MNTPNKLAVIVVSSLALIAPNAFADNTYQTLLDNLKQSHIAKLVTQEQQQKLETSYQACQAKLASIKDRNQYLQRQLEQQQQIMNSAAPVAERQFAEMEVMSLREKREAMQKRSAQCKEIETKYHNLSEKITQAAKKHSSDSQKHKQKLVEYLTNKSQLSNDAVIDSIEYPCGANNKLTCRKEATSALLKQISEQRSIKLTAGTIIKNYMVEQDTVATHSEAEFDKVEVLTADYKQLASGPAYYLKLKAQFKKQSDSAQNKVDKLRIEAAISRYLKALNKEFAGES
ncbi:hypothetical protein DS2_18378 [Catenovulum agarivorans DS-2]|uniref:Uncharacterized protein n=1 Tax=Catenovulum agarivorans DS-2 TaxID=1328313 RepID=W7QH12_9ALTE|nr:hypothetical protein [Catenovulum agarivorans]EWH08237.1 hypothetical protein DS2_18378 [Catenovulum agarivorans DS-2]